MNHKHRHYIVTGTLTEAPRPEYLPTLEDWFRRLIEAVNMNILFDPVCLWCDDEGNEGVTGVVGLTTSHSAIHFFSGLEGPYFQMDLYSCSDFSLDVVNELLREFGTKKIEYTFINRDFGEKHTVETGTLVFDEYIDHRKWSKLWVKNGQEVLKPQRVKGPT